jgi:hypothetical protein
MFLKKAIKLHGKYKCILLLLHFRHLAPHHSAQHLILKALGCDGKVQNGNFNLQLGRIVGIGQLKHQEKNGEEI